MGDGGAWGMRPDLCHNTHKPNLLPFSPQTQKGRAESLGLPWLCSNTRKQQPSSHPQGPQSPRRSLRTLHIQASPVTTSVSAVCSYGDLFGIVVSDLWRGWMGLHCRSPFPEETPCICLRGSVEIFSKVAACLAHGCGDSPVFSCSSCHVLSLSTREKPL